MTNHTLLFSSFVAAVLFFLFFTVVNIRRKTTTRTRIKGFLIANTLMFPLVIGVGMYGLTFFNAAAILTLFSANDSTNLVVEFLVLATFFFIFIISFLVTEILLIVKLKKTS